MVQDELTCLSICIGKVRNVTDVEYVHHYSGARVMMMGSCGFFGAIVAQVWQFAKLQMDAFMPGQ